MNPEKFGQENEHSESKQELEWQEYYEKSKQLKPRWTLVQALEFVTNRDSALDIGAGSLKDAKYLLQENFNHVTALDVEPVAQKDADALPSDKFNYIITPVESYDFPKNEYDFVSAQSVLPFLTNEEVSQVLENIMQSLKPDGILNGQIFGENEYWEKFSHPVQSIYTKEEAENLITSLGGEVILFREVDRQEPNVHGSLRRFHYFNFIIKKSS
ncbi:MAG TPA: class I SAM-dependent methyltransferase [Candidatus Paceibacterota bacterium]